MAKNSKLISMATGGTKKPVQKEVVKKVKEIVKTLTPEEERDIKAKETVKSLLDGVELDIVPKEKKEDELLEVDSSTTQNSEWLQEQVALLASENELLKHDFAVAKSDYQRIFAENQAVKSSAGIQSDDDMKNGLLTVFHELQSQYMKNPGFTPYGTPNFVIVPAAFINRLIVFFPFLAKEKRF